MLKSFKKFINLFFVYILISSCTNDDKITITKLENSPSFENASLSLQEIKIENNEYFFLFESENYNLGDQTEIITDYKLANSNLGQHIHLIVNNGPYSAHYDDEFSKILQNESNVILAFLSRSYHESVKNKNAFILTQTGNNNIDLNNEFLFYSRPKGTYKNDDTEKILLDFYLVNTEISKNGNSVRVTINDSEFYIYEWSPYVISGLPKGETNIKLELLNKENQLIQTKFNPSSRTIILE